MQLKERPFELADTQQETKAEAALASSGDDVDCRTLIVEEPNGERNRNRHAAGTHDNAFGCRVSAAPCISTGTDDEDTRNTQQNMKTAMRCRRINFVDHTVSHDVV